MKDTLAAARKIEQLDLVNMDKSIQAAERQVSDRPQPILPSG